MCPVFKKRTPSRSNEPPPGSHPSPAAGNPPRFTVALRGYDQRQVARFVARVVAGERVPVTEANFDIVLRGYDRSQVDEWIRAAAESGGGRHDGGT